MLLYWGIVLLTFTFCGEARFLCSIDMCYPWVIRQAVGLCADGDTTESREVDIAADGDTAGIDSDAAEVASGAVTMAMHEAAGIVAGLVAGAAAVSALL